MTAPRIAIVGMVLESNSFAPVVTADVFHGYLHLEGEDIIAQARAQNSRAPRELAAFVTMMDCTGDWTPVPLLVSASPPGGPVDHDYFESVIAEIETGLAAVDPVDGVYIANHGAMTTTRQFDADGEFVRCIRRAVGGSTKIIMTLDLHANISDQMVDGCDCIVGYLTNPHVDQIQCGEEAAAHMRQMLAARYKSQSVLVRLPLTPASVTLLTREGPYAEVINYGQRRQRELGGAVINVSVFGGFVFSDTPKNGIAVVVTARDDRQIALRLANEIASFTWSQRERFQKTLTSLDEAIKLVKERSSQAAMPAIIFSDAGDNPGGGGSGTTTELLQTLVENDVTGVLYGSFYEPELANVAMKSAIGTTIEVTLNKNPIDGTGDSLTVVGEVVALSCEDLVGRRGIYAGRRLKIGPVAAIRIGASRGITIVLISQRVQTADPAQFEMLGLDIAAARVIVVKSRGHFRAGFDEWFQPEQIFEIDTVGFTSPVLQRFSWSGLPRPVFPLDPKTQWLSSGV